MTVLVAAGGVWRGGGGLAGVASGSRVMGLCGGSTVDAEGGGGRLAQVVAASVGASRRSTRSSRNSSIDVLESVG